MFGFGKPYFLGIDVGTSLVKVVELTLKEGKPVLSNYGQVSLAALEKGELSSLTRSYDEEVALYLCALFGRLKPKSKSVSISMPAFIGLISIIDLPEMENSELEKAIQFEAHKYIPSALSEVVLSWEVVGTRISPSDGKKKMEILLVAALNKEVERYEKYARAINLEMNLLELETFSLVRSVVGKEPGLILVIDIGSRATNLVLVENGTVKVSRNLDIGGNDITHTFIESLNITKERAEILKKSEKDFLNNPESALVFPTLQSIASEAQRMLTSYQAKYPETACQSVIISGGTAQFTGLMTYYSKLFKLPVRIGNPWQRVLYDQRLVPNIQKLGASFSVAIGLALSGVDARVEKKEKKEAFSLSKFFTKKYNF